MQKQLLVFLCVCIGSQSTILSNPLASPPPHNRKSPPKAPKARKRLRLHTKAQQEKVTVEHPIVTLWLRYVKETNLPKTTADPDNLFACAIQDGSRGLSSLDAGIISLLLRETGAPKSCVEAAFNASKTHIHNEEMVATRVPYIFSLLLILLNEALATEFNDRSLISVWFEEPHIQSEIPSTLEAQHAYKAKALFMLLKGHITPNNTTPSIWSKVDRLEAFANSFSYNHPSILIYEMVRIIAAFSAWAHRELEKVENTPVIH